MQKKERNRLSKFENCRKQALFHPFFHFLIYLKKEKRVVKNKMKHLAKRGCDKNRLGASNWSKRKEQNKTIFSFVSLSFLLI
jgi:hypothetical protein